VQNPGNPHKTLLVTSAIIEAGAGVALILVPAMTVRLLIGVPFGMPSDAVIGRLTGAALLALAFACWNARVDAAGVASRGLVAGMLLYNAAAAALLSYSGFNLGLAGTGLWPVALLHLVMTIWCLASLKRSRELGR